MGRKRDTTKPSTNITVNFDKESYEWLMSKSHSEWGKIPLGHVVQCAIKKLMALD